MAWKTLYVAGRSGFDKEVLYHFRKSYFDFMTGSFNEDSLYLFWVTDNFDLERFKKEIGSKGIFKYRIRFFFGVDAFVTFMDKRKKYHGFTVDQEQMFRDLNR